MSLEITPVSGYWTFLGQGTASATVRTTDVTWGGQFQQLMIECYVTGTSNSTVPRLIVGSSAGPSESALLMNSQFIETVTATNNLAVPGWPLSGSIANRSRYAIWFINNQQSVAKRARGFGEHNLPTPIAGTASVGMQYSSTWINITDLIQSARMTNYDAVTGAVVSARTMNAGSYLNVWGKNND